MNIKLLKYTSNTLFKPILNISDCNFPGVWCLLGVHNNGNPQCLQVAMTKHISQEITKDLKIITTNTALIPQIQNTNNSYHYINQFGKEVAIFKQPIKRNDIRTQVYTKIANDYKDGELYFYLFNIETLKERKLYEKYFAYHTEALFWRNGRPFKTCKNVDVELLKTTLNNIIYNDNDLKNQLESAYTALIKKVTV